MFPMTKATPKALLPVYDQPSLLYAVATVMELGADEILIIGRAGDIGAYGMLIGDGAQWGVHVEYAVQTYPRGTADALIVASRFIAEQGAILMFPDNTLLAPATLGRTQSALARRPEGCILVGARVQDPTKYGVLELDRSGRISAITEKPPAPQSDIVAVGLYYFDGSGTRRAMDLEPTERGELEITDLVRTYVEGGQGTAIVLEEDEVWCDVGDPDELLRASAIVRDRSARPSSILFSPETVAVAQHRASVGAMREQVSRWPNSHYKTRMLQSLTLLTSTD